MATYGDLSFDSLINSLSENHTDVTTEGAFDPADAFFRMYTESEETSTDDETVKYKKVDSGFIAKVKMSIRKLVDTVIAFINDKIDSLKQTILNKQYEKMLKAAEKNSNTIGEGIKVIDYKDISKMIDELEKLGNEAESIIHLASESPEKIDNEGEGKLAELENKVDKLIDGAIVYDKTINITMGAGLSATQMLYRKALLQNKFKFDYNYMEKLEYADQVSFYTNVIKLQMRIRKEIMKLLYSSSKSMFSAVIAAVKSSSSMSAKDTTDADDNADINLSKNFDRARTLSESFFLASDISDEEIFNEASNDAFLNMDFSF
jgi:hypothetical protein|nr:MAG TPA: hypothetical protein [Caudoviricetes sp.]